MTTSWNPETTAPRFAAPGVDVKTGDYVVAINGEELKAPDNIYRLLDGTASHQTVLSVNSRPGLEGARQVTVVPVANEQTLRTRAWVEDNRRLVDKLSGGKLAYVYLPNTSQPGYSSFNRYYFAQQDSEEGVVVDERYNGGVVRPPTTSSTRSSASSTAATSTTSPAQPYSFSLSPMPPASGDRR